MKAATCRHDDNIHIQTIKDRYSGGTKLPLSYYLTGLNIKKYYVCRLPLGEVDAQDIHNCLDHRQMMKNEGKKKKRNMSLLLYTVYLVQS